MWGLNGGLESSYRMIQGLLSGWDSVVNRFSLVLHGFFRVGLGALLNLNCYGFLRVGIEGSEDEEPYLDLHVFYGWQ